MAVYFITGKLGCGKTLCTVGKIRDYLEQGRRVATNLDINLAALTKPDSMVSITRVPDKPMLYDLNAIGLGCEEEDESKYGLLVLDELGTWFNSRNWRDKGRGEAIDWFLHARKKHWDVFFIVQNINSLDDQLVSALCEHLVVCSRTDRLKIPFVGSLLKTLGIQAMLPKIHIAKVYYGQTTSSMAVDRWWYRGRDLYPAYNTAQIFDDESHAVHSVLPAYYTNNISLIATHQGKIKALTQVDTRPKPPPASIKTSAIAFFTVFLLVISWRTYAKYSDMKAPVIQPTAQVVSPVTLSNPIQPVIVPFVEKKPLDIIEKMTKDAIITVSSYFVADSQINAILHLAKGDSETVITLADVRAAGYVATLQGKFATVTKENYSFSFQIPN